MNKFDHFLLLELFWYYNSIIDFQNAAGLIKALQCSIRHNWKVTKKNKKKQCDFLDIKIRNNTDFPVAMNKKKHIPAFHMDKE